MLSRFQHRPLGYVRATRWFIEKAVPRVTHLAPTMAPHGGGAVTLIRFYTDALDILGPEQGADMLEKACADLQLCVPKCDNLNVSLPLAIGAHPRCPESLRQVIEAKLVEGLESSGTVDALHHVGYLLAMAARDIPKDPREDNLVSRHTRTLHELSRPATPLDKLKLDETKPYLAQSMDVLGKFCDTARRHPEMLTGQTARLVLRLYDEHHHFLAPRLPDFPAENFIPAAWYGGADRQHVLHVTCVGALRSHGRLLQTYGYDKWRESYMEPVHGGTPIANDFAVMEQSIGESSGFGDAGSRDPAKKLADPELSSDIDGPAQIIRGEKAQLPPTAMPSEKLESMPIPKTFRAAIINKHRAVSVAGAPSMLFGAECLWGIPLCDSAMKFVVQKPWGFAGVVSFTESLQAVAKGDTSKLQSIVEGMDTTYVQKYAAKALGVHMQHRLHQLCSDAAQLENTTYGNFRVWVLTNLAAILASAASPSGNAATDAGLVMQGIEKTPAETWARLARWAQVHVLFEVLAERATSGSDSEWGSNVVEVCQAIVQRLTKTLQPTDLDSEAITGIYLAGLQRGELFDFSGRGHLSKAALEERICNFIDCIAEADLRRLVYAERFGADEQVVAEARKQLGMMMIGRVPHGPAMAAMGLEGVDV